jgi:hypothetical protein
LGIFGFLLYCFLFFLLWKDVVKNFYIYKYNDKFKLYFTFLLFTTGALISSKDHSYMLVGLLIGFYLNYKREVKGLKI